jgi:hypothetical protein
LLKPERSPQLVSGRAHLCERSFDLEKISQLRDFIQKNVNGRSIPPEF